LERVLNYDPKGIDFEKEETRLQMVNDVYGPEKIADYKSGKLKLRFNISDKAKWIRTMIVQKNPNIELSDSSVRRYIVYLDSVTPELMAYTMGDKISLRDSMVLSTLPAKDQNEAVAACGTPKFKVLLAQAKKLGREGNKKDGISMEGIPPVSPEESIQMANDMVMLGKKLVGISEAYEKFSDKLLGAELTRDQTIVMKKMNDVMRAIEKLKHSV
jgi:hypothetical protein